MAKTLFFGIFIYKQEFGTVEPEMLKSSFKTDADREEFAHSQSIYKFWC